MITFALTSCNRPDLLSRTLVSFLNTPDSKLIDRWIIVDDSAKPGCLMKFERKYPFIEFHYNEKRLGMLKSIDVLYSKIDTDYIFHCEDDWEFFRSGFIEASKKILEENQDVLIVWLRERGDTNGHPLEIEPAGEVDGKKFYNVEKNYMNQWHGYTTNPGLRRLEDVVNFGELQKDLPVGEENVSKFYHELGFRCVALDPGYVKHIGWGRSVGQPESK